MNRHLIAVFGTLTGFLSIAAYAAPGEYWEITSKMEMPGMPFAMPATTQKVCISKGNENNPEKTSGDKNCKMTDVKTVGNKTTWKARCDHDGEIMTGVGEQTTNANGYQGKIQFSGKSRGQDMNMNMAFSGKRVGGSCDSEEAANKVKAQMCDKSQYRNTADWIGGADLILQKDSPCANQRQQLCDLVRQDTPREVSAYDALLLHDKEKSSRFSVARECKVDVSASLKALCKTFSGDNYNQLAKHCPAEAKKYREVQRRKECEGREYTAETRAADLKKCLSGKEDTPRDESTNEDEPAPMKSGKSSGGNTTNDVLQNAKKLKGMFGF